MKIRKLCKLSVKYHIRVNSINPCCVACSNTPFGVCYRVKCFSKRVTEQDSSAVLENTHMVYIIWIIFLVISVL